MYVWIKKTNKQTNWIKLYKMFLFFFFFSGREKPIKSFIQYRFSWIPIVCGVIVMLGLELGIFSIPYMLAVEYFPTYVRGLVSL